jgi:hypothetical protein
MGVNLVMVVLRYCRPEVRDAFCKTGQENIGLGQRKRLASEAAQATSPAFIGPDASGVAAIALGCIESAA